MLYKIQWNLYKAYTERDKKVVHFIQRDKNKLYFIKKMYSLFRCTPWRISLYMIKYFLRFEKNLWLNIFVLNIFLYDRHDAFANVGPVETRTTDFHSTITICEYSALLFECSSSCMFQYCIHWKMIRLINYWIVLSIFLSDINFDINF